ncbi:MAG: hypothetical protein ACK4V2_02990 [Pseudomonadota bacterium]|jgi:hypothetical protein
MTTNPKIQRILSLVAISLSLVTIIVDQCKESRFATVDMGQLINLQAAQLGQQYPDGKVPTAVMQHLIADLKDRIKEVAQEKKVILLAKGAVLNDSLPDYTELLNESLASQAEEQEKEED